MTLSLRTTQVLSLSTDSSQAFVHPEQIVLQFPHGPIIDIGALCFSVRAFTGYPKRKHSEYRRVDFETFCSARAEIVVKLIQHIFENSRTGRRRPETLRDIVSRFVAFVGWADQAGWQQALTDLSRLRQSLIAYSSYLREQVWRLELKNNSAARQLHVVTAFCEDFFDMEDIRNSLHLLKVDRKLKQSAVPPSEELQSRVLSLTSHLTQGLADLVLNHALFPYPLQTPGYLNFPQNTLWIFPTSTWFSSPAVSKDREPGLRPGRGFDYEKGRLVTLEELRAVNSNPELETFARNRDISRRMVVRNSNLQLLKANQDLKHYQRRRLAQIAMSMFCVLFVAETGMNWAQVVELTWNCDYEVVSSRQGFRAVKWRAGAKSVSFELSIGFMPQFKTYLLLREFLLDGKHFEFLFLRFGPKAQSKTPGPMKGDLTTLVFDVLRRIDPSLDRVTTREWRAAKSDWLIRNSDPSTASLLLQNTERTLLDSYAEGSVTVHLEEMSGFLNEVSRKVAGLGQSIGGVVPNSVGKCQDHGNPQPVPSASTVPDCKKVEGCLFCEKYRIHADIVDTRKLISYRHCLRATSTLGENAERIAETFRPIFDRIESIIDELRVRDNAMVELVEDEVDQEGELDFYWARKYEMLLAIGAIV